MREIVLGLDIKKISESKFDPYRIPPHLGECYFHRKVTQFGKPIENTIQEYEGIDGSQSPTLIMKGEFSLDKNIMP